LAKLKVIAWSSVFRYKGKDRDVQAVGRALNVRAVLVGQIKQEGDELTITAELISVGDNQQIWFKAYDHQKTGDIQTVQKEIAQSVSEKLSLQVTGTDKTKLTKTYTANGEAYEAYLKGRYHWNKRSKEGFELATKFFQEAVDKDPNYALAYTGLADCFTLRSDYGFLMPTEGYALAKSWATLALRYDDSLAEAHTSMASIKAVTDWDWQGAENEYRRAIELKHLRKYKKRNNWILFRSPSIKILRSYSFMRAITIKRWSSAGRLWRSTPTTAQCPPILPRSMNYNRNTQRRSPNSKRPMLPPLTMPRLLTRSARPML